MEELKKEERLKQVSLFYKYLKPSATSRLIFDRNKNIYSAETLLFTKTEETFVVKTLKLNETGDCFAARNRFHDRRLEKNVHFLKTFVIDIDDDFDGAKSKKFEKLCSKYKIYIEAKAFSGAGFHYYVSYKPTEITDANRKQVKEIGLNFRQFLLNNNIDVDKRIFDLVRLIRIWGCKNHKRGTYCKLIKLHSATDAEICHNTEFLNSLSFKKPDLPTVDSLVTSCLLVEHVRKNNLEVKNPEAFINDKLLKNVAIFLKSLYGEQGRAIAFEICNMQEHNPGEMEGWWQKAGADIAKFSCGELNLFLKASFPDLLSQTCSKCRLLNKNKIEYVDSNESFSALKKLARKKNKLLINKEIFIKGVISPGSSSYKQELIVYRVFTHSDTEDVKVIFFDEKVPASKKWEEQIGLSADFFVYEVIETGNNFLLLSEKELDFGEYYLEGSATKLTDKLLIGNYGKIASRRKIILLYKAKSLINKISTHEKLFRVAEGLTREKITDYIFSYYDEDENKHFIFRQPRNINNLIVSFLFSAKFEFPLHLCLYGKQDSGKTKIIGAIFQKFNEPYSLVDGSNSSLKGLVPSFAGPTPKIGVLLESKRLCAIDEFFRIIKGEEDRDKLSVLNNFLLHTKYTNRTGKGNIDIKMRSKLLTVTNPLYGENFEGTIRALPPSTIDRILVWKQYKSHYNWVRLGKNKLEKKPDVDKYKFLAIYDYLNSFKSDFELVKVTEIVDELKAKVPSYMINLYETRYGNHHSKCLMDGLVKFRCLAERDVSFKATEADYEEFYKLWEDLVLGWWDNLEQEDINRLLTQEQKALMKIIENNKDIWDYQLEKKCEEGNIDYKHNYKRLLNLNLIEVNNRKISLVEEHDIDFVK